MGILDGRVAIITGSARGIGRDHARLFAQEGASVVVNDYGEAADGALAEVVEELESRGARAVGCAADVSSAEGADRLIDTAVSVLGGLDVLVNNAGILRDSPIVTMTDDAWELIVQVNLRGHFMPLRAAARYWRKESKAGRSVRASVINTSSESGVFANAAQANYAAAKAGVAALSEVASKELRRYGVRSNAILPRARTRLTEDIVGEAKLDAFDKWDPANVSPFVAYLAMDECPITGQVFLVAGDLVQRATPWSLDPNWIIRAGKRRWELPDLVKAVGEVGLPTNEGRLTGNVP
jgi:NAD(P)-dependent dehydrogenase (short-subunit alcohol dehydrogenase family)